MHPMPNEYSRIAAIGACSGPDAASARTRRGPTRECSSCNLNPIIPPQPICDAAVVPRPASQPRPANVGDADREEGTDHDVNDADRDLLSLEGEADVGDATRI